MAQERLQKIISEAGICSRRKAELLIRQKRLSINGKIANIGDKADICIDKVSIDGEQIYRRLPHIVILVNKPIGYISSCNDNHGRPTLLNLIPSHLRDGLYPIGRLDLNSRGAILLSNHGELALHITHPRYDHSKTYEVKVRGYPNDRSLSLWRNGLILDGKKTKESKIEVLESKSNETLLKVIMREGKKRQIRRIAKIIGYPVIDLKRTAIGHIHLNDLKEGNWRIVHQEEWGKFLPQNK